MNERGSIPRQLRHATRRSYRRVFASIGVYDAETRFDDNDHRPRYACACGRSKNIFFETVGRAHGIGAVYTRSRKTSETAREPVKETTTITVAVGSGIR